MSLARYLLTTRPGAIILSLLCTTYAASTPLLAGYLGPSGLTIRPDRATTATPIDTAVFISGFIAVFVGALCLDALPLEADDTDD